MKVVIAPDGFGGTLSAAEATRAIAEGWQSARPVDTLVTMPMSDGGEGFLDVVARPGDVHVTCEVADPHGRPIDATILIRGSTAIIEAARACGLMLLDVDERDPRRTTTFGVGQLLAAARARGVERIVLGVGGSATVDGGAGALTGLGFRVRRADGSGLKIGGGELVAVDRVDAGWAPSFDGIAVDVLADVDIPL
ncbi:MAG: glycerate kinase, partial [Nitriliruptoraceae bacterium]